MKPIISDMVQRYESGGLTRRELIQGLALLVAAGEAPAQPSSQGGGLIASGIDHVSVRVRDVRRSAAFYQSLFGLSQLGEDKPHRIVRLGRKRVIVSLREDTPHGTIDHFGVGVENFDKQAVGRVLQNRGLAPQEDWEYGFYVKDPDGVPVQMLMAT